MPHQSGPALAESPRRDSPPRLLAALEHLDRGWAVFPLRADDKKPAIPKARGGQGYKDASLDREKVTRCWTDHPHLNIGIATGAVSNTVAIDLDEHGPKSGGESLSALEARHGALPSTHTVETPRGGHHLVFQHPGVEVPCSQGPEFGIDVRGDGGYVVGPGSVIGGRPYRVVVDLPPASLPAWLLLRILSGNWNPDVDPSSLMRSGDEKRMTTSTSTRPGVHSHDGSAQSNERPVGAETENRPESKSDDPLGQAEKVALVLKKLGRPDVRFWATTTENFSCLIPGHADHVPSASMHLGKGDGRWSYRCHSTCGVSLTMAELFATVTAGRLVKFEKSERPTIARWLHCMWHEAGVDPVKVPELDVATLELREVRLTAGDRAWAKGFLKLGALRHHHGDHDSVPYTHGFAAAWCGISESTARRAAQKLRNCGWLRVKAAPPGVRCGLLYDLGTVQEQNPANPFSGTVAWVVLGDDGLPIGHLPPIVLGESLGDPPIDNVAGQEGNPVVLEVVLPAFAAGVEVEAGEGAVDEADNLHHVAQVGFAECVARLGRFDAPSGPAGGVVSGHTDEPYAAGWPVPLKPDSEPAGSECPFLSLPRSGPRPVPWRERMRAAVERRAGLHQSLRRDSEERAPASSIRMKEELAQNEPPAIWASSGPEQDTDQGER